MDRYVHSSSKNYLIVKNKPSFGGGRYCIFPKGKINTPVSVTPLSDQGGEL